MDKKIKIVLLLSIFLVLTTTNVIVYEVKKEKDSIPCFLEGRYEGSFVNGKWVKYKLTLHFKAISKKEYQSFHGKNVVKDCSGKRKSDYYLIEGVLAIDEQKIDLFFINLQMNKLPNGEYVYYDDNNNYIMPGYYESYVFRSYVSVNYNHHFVPASYMGG